MKDYGCGVRFGGGSVGKGCGRSGVSVRSVVSDGVGVG